jgi:hypothetical protein
MFWRLYFQNVLEAVLLDDIHKVLRASDMLKPTRICKSWVGGGLLDHKTDDCTGFEEEHISAAKLYAILQNTEGCE